VYQNALLPFAQRVDDLISRMSPRQKVAQLNCAPLVFMQAERKEAVMGQGMGHFSLSVSSGESIEQNIALVEEVQSYLVEQTELGIPAIVHTEALSGAMLAGATNFPGAIALAATWDPEGIEAMGRVIARQLVPLGIRHVLSPVMDVARDPRWGRIGETYGEDVALVARMSVAFVKGVQGDDLSRGVAATGKHFLGYAMSEGAMNTTMERIGPRELREVYAKTFAAAIHEAGLATIMNSYSTLDSVPIVASPEILTDLLRGELGYDGVVTTDALDMDAVSRAWGIPGAAVRALAAGADMLLLGYAEGEERCAAIRAAVAEAVRAGELPLERVEEAAERVRRLGQAFQRGRVGGRAPQLGQPAAQRAELLAQLGAEQLQHRVGFRVAHRSLVRRASNSRASSRSPTGRPSRGKTPRARCATARLTVAGGGPSSRRGTRPTWSTASTGNTQRSAPRCTTSSRLVTAGGPPGLPRRGGVGFQPAWVESGARSGCHVAPNFL
jgi:beta-glucosidase-like glycosyl hydrolase